MPSTFLRRLAALVLALPALVPRCGAGPAVACPDGPDPLRFRPEAAVADVSPAPSPLGLAAAVDGSGASRIALAYLTPGDEVAVTVSADGGCTFSPPLIVSAPGAIVQAAPAVAVRVAAPALLAVAWSEGGRIVVRASTNGGAAFGPETELEALAASAPRIAIAPQGPSLLAAAWLRDDGSGGTVPRVALTQAGDGTGWSAGQDVQVGAAPALEIDLACDLAGVAGGPGCSLIAALGGGEAHVARLDDPAGSWDASRRVDDGSASSLGGIALASGADAGPSAWTALALSSVQRMPAGAIGVLADAARTDGGLLGTDFDGASGSPTPVLDAGGSGPRRPALAVAGSLAYAAFEEAGEIQLARRPLADARPRMAGGCGPSRVTGLFPPRAGGAASAPVAAALGNDVVLAFVDDRDGAPRAFVKRSDSQAPDVALTNASPSSCGQPPRVLLEWSALPCDAVSITVEIGSIAGGTDFTRSVAGGTSLLVEGLEPARGYFFRMRIVDAAGFEQVTNEVSALTPTCTGAVVQASILSVTDACAAGGAGGDGSVDPGETLRVTVRYLNEGTEAAASLLARLQSRSPFVTVRTGSQALGDLAPAATADAVFDVDVSATAPCGSVLRLLGRSDLAGDAWADLLELAIPPACTACRLPGCSVVADASRTAPLAICRGAQVTLDATATTASSCAGTALHEWWSGASLLGTGNALMQSPTASTSYRLVTRCSTDLDCMSEDSVDVVVHPLPAVTITPDPPPPHCAGQAVTLTVTTGDPAATFAWDDGTITDRIVVTEAGLHGVTVTDGNGCRRSRQVRVDFGEVPVADAGPDVAGCSSVLLGTPGFPLLDYSWEPAAGLLGAGSAQAVALASGTYTLTVTDPLTGCSSSDQVVAGVSPGPAAPLDLRVSKQGSSLEASWTRVAGSPGGRLYSETIPQLAGIASSRSPGAQLRCESGAGCTIAMTPEPLLFLQAVSLCSDGISEGPN